VHSKKECMCSAGMVQKYLNRISDPLLDRIDIPILSQIITNNIWIKKSG